MATTVTLSQPVNQEIKFITLKPNGTPLAGFADGYMGVGSFAINTKGSMGELKQAEVEFELDFGGGENWDNKQITYLPAMYVDSGQTQPNPIPGIGWKFTITPGMAAGTYSMAWIGAFGLDNMIRNYECKLTFVNNTTKIIIKHKFYLVYDEQNFLSVTPTPQNAWRWQKTNYNADPVMNQDPNTVFPYFDMNTVYGAITKKYGYYIYVKNTTTSESGNMYQYWTVAWGFMNRRFQNSGPAFTAPAFEFSVAGIASGLNLSHTQATKVRFRAEDTFGYTPTNCFAYLIRTDSGLNINNTFLNTYSYPFPFSATEITTVGGTGTINNAIKAPSTALAPVVADEWDVSFHIDHTKLIVGAKYKVIVIWYANPADVAPFGNQYVTSYESEELTAFFIPPYDPETCEEFTFEKGITDYKNVLVGADCIITVPEDRLKFGGFFDTDHTDVGGTTFGACILARLGLALPLNDVRRWLKKITVEIYEEYVVGPDTFKNVFQRDTIVRTAPNVYTIPSPFEFYSTDWSTGFICTYELRVRYEPGVSNMESYVNGVLVSPTSNQNWVNKNLQVRFSFEFEYFDYSPTFTEVYHSYFLMCVEPYENDQVDPVILCDGDEPGSAGYQVDAFLLCHPGPCNPGDTTPNVAAYQAVGELPAIIPLGLTILFINDWPSGFAGIFSWNGSTFTLTHTIVIGDIVCVLSKYVDGEFVPHAIYYEFLEGSARIDDGCPFVAPATNCDNYILCKGDQLCIDFLLDLEECEEYLVIGTIDRPIWGIMNIQEEENEPGELPQLDSGHISLPLTYWSEDPLKPCVGTVCIDSAGLNIGTTYKVSIMAKRTLAIIPPCPEFKTIEIDLATEVVDPDLDIYRLVAQTTITDAANGKAEVYYLDKPATLADQITTDTTGWNITNDDEYWQIGDGEINILINWGVKDDFCDVVNQFLVRIEFNEGTSLFELIEIIDFGPDVTHDETLSYEARVNFVGGTLDTNERTSIDYWRKYINVQRSKYVRHNPFSGDDLAACLVPFLFNTDESLTPIGNLIDVNTNFVSGNYTQFGAGAGLQGTGLAYLDTGVVPSAEAVLGLNSVGLFFYSKTTGTNPTIEIGCFDGTQVCYLAQDYSGLNTLASINDFTSDNVAASTKKMYGAVRSASNVKKIYQDDTPTTFVTASMAELAFSIMVFAYNSSGTASGISGRKLCSYSIVQDFDDVEAKRHVAATKFYMIKSGKL